MTSAQRSESADMMLKTYVPPGRAMNKFLEHYMRLQHDHEANAGYEEKRTKWKNRCSTSTWQLKSTQAIFTPEPYLNNSGRTYTISEHTKVKKLRKINCI